MKGIRLSIFKKNRIGDFIAVILILFTTFYCLIETFEFSESFSLSALRQIDDPTYHLDLRRLHEAFLNFDLHQLLLANNNAYGWVFWIVHAIFTFPFYLVDKIFHITQPLVVSGRLLSIFFTMFTSVIVYKISKIYCSRKLNQVLCLATFLTFPAIAVSSMRFCSDTQSVFFGVLAIYWTLKTNVFDRKQLAIIALFMGLAIGTKFTGVFVLPFIGIHLISSYNWKIDKKILKDATFFLVLIGLFSVFFVNPGFYLVPFTRVYSGYFVHMYKTYSQFATANTGLPDNLMYIYKNSIAYGFLGQYTTIIAIGLLFAKFMANFKVNEKISTNFLMMFFSLVILFLYLVISIFKGPSYINLYFSSIAFFLCLSFSFFEELPKKAARIFAILFFVVILVENGKKTVEAYSQFYTKRNLPQFENLYNVHDDIKELIASPDKDNPIAALVDYRAVFPYFELDGNMRYIVLIDDLSVRKNWHAEFDYIVLSRDSVAFLPEAGFNHVTSLSDPETRKKYIADRQDVQTLLNQGELQKGNLQNPELKFFKYSTIYDKNQVIVFKLMKTN